MPIFLKKVCMKPLRQGQWIRLVLAASEELTNQVRKRKVVVSYHTLNLVELCQMGGIDGFVSEHAVDTEHLDGFEPTLPIRKTPEQIG